MTKDGQIQSELALFGGEKAVKLQQEDMFKWPVVTERHEQAVLKVLVTTDVDGDSDCRTIHTYSAGAETITARVNSTNIQLYQDHATQSRAIRWIARRLL